MKRLNFVFAVLFIFLTNTSYTQWTDLFLGNNSNGQRFILHGRNAQNGDFLQITYDDGSGNWVWDDGFTLKRSTGYFGIGTTSPTSKLTVKGTGRFTKSDDDNKIISIGFFNSFGYEYGGISAFDGSTGKNIIFNGSPTGVATANIGIGMLDPIQALDVGGRLNIRYGVIQNGTTAVTGTEDLGLYSTRSGYYLRLVTTSAPIRFYTDGGTGSTAKMTIESNGSVGIGTESPSSTYLLSVNGKVRAKEIKVESSWSDFVFKPGYKLKTLSEVESYIKENGHLPEIPSEQEVTENGVELGDITSKLLMKIEELTLYIIEQQKEIEKLNSYINTKNE